MTVSILVDEAKWRRQLFEAVHDILAELREEEPDRERLRRSCCAVADVAAEAAGGICLQCGKRTNPETGTLHADHPWEGGVCSACLFREWPRCDACGGQVRPGEQEPGTDHPRHATCQRLEDGDEPSRDRRGED